jgi:hypothetical protein
MIVTEFHSNPSVLVEKPTDDPIHVIYQFFLSDSEARVAEIQKTLRLIIENKHIDKVHLLNERIYTDEELGLSEPSNKIIQTNIGSRLTFQNCFSYLRENNVLGYQVIINSDICFDDTISNLKKTDIHLRQKMYALMRFEYNEEDIQKSNLFEYSSCCQDTWIFHSNFPIPIDKEEDFNFYFGRQGCDNRTLYLVHKFGYEIINDPYFVKTYHIHKTNGRTYGEYNRIPSPYVFVFPYLR